MHYRYQIVEYHDDFDLEIEAENPLEAAREIAAIHDRDNEFLIASSETSITVKLQSHSGRVWTFQVSGRMRPVYSAQALDEKNVVTLHCGNCGTAYKVVVPYSYGGCPVCSKD
jgi:hypothetical protein